MKTLILALMLTIAGISSSIVLAHPATAEDETTYTSGGPGKDHEPANLNQNAGRR